MKLLDKKIITGTITLETGLHIGGSKSSMDIGGLDSPVIKTPLGVPYIPGSSFKGKIRSLLAKKEGSDDVKNDSEILKKLFGSSTDERSGNTRLIFRDAYLDTKKFKENFAGAQMDEEFSEGKFENVIDRKSGKAQHPRQIERVPAGAVFDFEIVMDVYEGDDASEFENKLKEGFDLLQNDYLGGSGTRGYGKVNILHTINEAKINAGSHS
ncbi:CRISPR-associated protein Csm3 [Cruoricaptor ignavus]|uniref:CRISPR system Cms endoribonuclease Csm3 n=1 Tax=Cruoricaptor ignavus TaxID=1118202 RepID=A0A1M6DK41_9FLAO|nr:type III-A CRISPR-associated RAMP protein Csm3 [Cruoricaptor ignavus]SHI73575.1 CRISPR-associated protein Csm3 [Cruoricaptor ignavus]